MRNLVIFTDIDREMVADRDMRDVLRRLDARGIPVVPVTALTFEEAVELADELQLRHSMIIESGGGIARWNGAAWDVESCSVSSDELLNVVAEIEDRSHAHLQVQSVTPGASPRAFSEPFVIEKGDLEEVVSAAESLGFSVRRGRQLLHLCRRCDEGEAFSRVRRELACDVAIALGDSPVDANFLARADVAIVLRQQDGEADRELLAQVPSARIAPAPGGIGWAAAVEECLAERARPA